MLVGNAIQLAVVDNYKQGKFKNSQVVELPARSVEPFVRPKRASLRVDWRDGSSSTTATGLTHSMPVPIKSEQKGKWKSLTLLPSSAALFQIRSECVYLASNVSLKVLSKRVKLCPIITRKEKKKDGILPRKHRKKRHANAAVHLRREHEHWHSK